ncbi:hypothetical protein R3P38DRAFT_3403195 [Favolaschia claudopus]|uniref:Glycosyltransferase 61 catalytic domain-containing protein n=1 Tax=Favolaschia claudopus TaxID=2862362 RepID=A0AAW0AH85_9AGAR
MLIYRRSVRRDATLVIIGATLTHLYSLLNRQQPTQILVNNVSIPPMKNQERPIPLATIQESSNSHGSPNAFQSRSMSMNSDSDLSTIAPTTLLTHAPGWTVLENLYMSNGTFFIVTDTPQDFPKIRFMISKPLILENTANNIAAREPTPDDMAFLTVEEANERWGEVRPGRKNRISTVGGNTVLVNDPDQFLGHYYHFVGELFFGIQAIWYGTFSSSFNRFNSNPTPNPSAIDALPPIHRVIFARASSIAWRDFPGFNYYFLRAAFPSTTVEVEDDWEDRAEITATGKRAWRFPLLLLTDRSASNRGRLCGTVTQRNAAEAVAVMRSKTKEKSGGGKEANTDTNADMAAWWTPVRDRLFEFADAGHEDVKGLPKPRVAAVHQVEERNQVVLGGGSSELPTPRSIVITYISRQSAGGRMLTRISHEELVSALEELAERKGWEFNVVQAEFLTHDEQLKLMARTTILLGVHGNGLTHVLMMQPTRLSTVIEIFFPGGFCHDYQWTATHGLGIKHYAVWNDTAHTEGEGEGKPKVNYPSGFQGNSIPVHGPFVSKLIEDHIERRR